MSTLKADTIQSTGGGAATLTKQNAAKVFINQQNDASANNTNSSFNVSSNTDNGSGDNTFSLTSAFDSAGYVVNCTSGASSATDRFGQMRTGGTGLHTSSSSFRTIAFDVSTGATNNIDGMQCVAHGDLA